MMERIQKIFSARGICSRRQAEEWIRAGRVSCNGTVCAIGDQADPDCDCILLDGKPIPSAAASVYIVLNKPRGYVTTLSDEKGRKNVTQLVEDCGCRVYPVGRLDMDSEGLLILTNDGAFANTMMHPRHEVKKTYRVTVKNFSPEAVERLKQPIELDGYRIQKPEVSVVEAPKSVDATAIITVTIHEGRNRQVRRMCDAAGMPVVRLARISEGCINLGQLRPGQWRYLTQEEVAALWK